MIFREELESFAAKICNELYSLPPSSYSLELYQPAGDLTEGLSGAPVFFVKDGRKMLIFVIKAFIGQWDTLENFAANMTAGEVAASLRLEEVSFACPFAYIRLDKNKHHATLLAFEAARGVSLNTLLKGKSIEKVHSAAQYLGRALGALNSKDAEKGRRLSPYYAERELQTCSACVKSISNQPSRFPLNVSALSGSFLLKWEKMQRVPLKLGYVHGDAHPGNVFFDEENQKLTLTDLERLAFSLDADKLPSGPVAFDFVFARNSLQFAAAAHGISEENRLWLDKAFADSYKREMKEHFPSVESQDYYATLFWMRKLHLIAAAGHDLQPLMEKQIELQRQMAIEFLKNY